jgi:hypothetical protein
MPKVHYVKARKDYPEAGVKKGDMHYVWDIKLQRGGIRRRSLTKPTPAQMTVSEYKTAAYGINESFEASRKDAEGDLDAIQSAVEEAKSDAIDLRDEQQEKLDNIPEGLQQGPIGELIQERISALETFIEELEALDFDPPADPEDENGFEVDGDLSKEARELLNSDGETMEEWKEKAQEEYDEWLQNLYEEASGLSIDVS